ncbi:MAG: hypothetical protein PHU44_17590 [Syntrophales bacterium]|nr:hypothetical protein [Syntrophales bacterium]MDD5640019.1 hypothetical protein [Syntrophales bacterium]
MSMVFMISGEWNNLQEITGYSGCTPDTAYRRTGNYGLKLSGSASYLYKAFTPLSEAYLQVAWLVGTGSAPNFTSFSLRNGTTSLISVARNASNLLEIRSGWGGTLLATGITPLLNNTWYVIEFHYRLADVNGVAELRVDGNLECTFTGDTRPGAETTFDQFYVSGAYLAANNTYIDDVVLNDLNGPGNNSWPGGLKLALLKPNAEGGTQEWTAVPGPAHYTAVDEVPPSGTDCVKTDQIDKLELFGLEDLPAEAQSVKAVALDFHGLKGSTVAPTRVAQVVNLGGTDYVQADQDLPMAQGLVRKILDQNPAGGNWSVAAVNALVAGVKSRP